MLKAILTAAVALAATPLATAPAGADSTRPTFATFGGLLTVTDNEGYYTSGYCYEVVANSASPATCTVKFKILSGRLTCDGVTQVSAEGRANYTNHTSGVTIVGIPLAGVALTEKGLLRGHIVDVEGTATKAFTIEITSFGPCQGGYPSAFRGTVTYN